MADLDEIGGEPGEVHPEDPAVAEVHEAEEEEVAAAQDAPPRDGGPRGAGRAALSISASSAWLTPRWSWGKSR